MKKMLCIAVLISFCSTLFAQQIGSSSYERHRGLYVIKGSIVVNNGHVKHTYSENGSIEHTLTYRCNPNVSSDCIVAVFSAIETTITAFWHLTRFSMDDYSSTIINYINKSIDECEDAIALYQKGGCTSRASGLMNMVEELTNAKGYSANRYDLYNRVQQIRNKYSYLDTYSTCGYVY